MVDPHRTVAAGKVEIGAFRTFPEVPCGGLEPYAHTQRRLLCVNHRCKRALLQQRGSHVTGEGRGEEQVEGGEVWEGTPPPAGRPTGSPPLPPCCCCVAQGYKPPDEGPGEDQTIPLDKIEDFGVHCKQVRLRPPCAQPFVSDCMALHSHHR